MALNSFGQRLKKYRKAKGLKQETLMQKLSQLNTHYLGYDSSIISKWETAKRQPPDRGTIISLAEALELNDVEADDLLLSANCPPLDYDNRLRFVRRTSNQLARIAKDMQSIRNAVGKQLQEMRIEFDRRMAQPITPNTAGIPAEVFSQDVNTTAPPKQKPVDSRVPTPSSGHYLIVREPIWGDVPLNELEAMVINTRGIRRLQHISTLGMVSLVYPSAHHSVFEHSIGTLAAAQEFINAINTNPVQANSISENDVRLIRISALLHDITEIPFRQSLEVESNILPKFGHVRRLAHFLRVDSEIGRLLIASAGYEFYRSCYDVLNASPDKIQSLESPFIADIVRNGLCAAILDSLSRDVHFTGIQQVWDKRLLQYAILSSANATYPNRVVFPLYEQGVMRRDVVTELLSLLQLHASLRKRIHFHPLVQSASAMLAEATFAATINSPPEFTEASLCSFFYGESELLLALERDGGSIAERLLAKLEQGALYKTIVKIQYRDPSVPREQMSTLVDRFSDAATRFEHARRLEKGRGFPEGTIILYCPKSEIILKESDIFVEWQNSEVVRLNDVPDDALKDMLDYISRDLSSQLAICVFVDPEIVSDQQTVADLTKDCFTLLGLPNP